MKQTIDDSPGNDAIAIYAIFFGFLIFLCLPLLKSAQNYLVLLSADLDRQINEQRAECRAKKIPGEYPVPKTEEISFHNGAIHCQTNASSITYSMQNTGDNGLHTSLVALNVRLQEQMIEMQSEQKRSQELIIEQRNTIAQESAARTAQLKMIEVELNDARKCILDYQRKVADRENSITHQVQISQHKYKNMRKKLSSSRRSTPEKIKITTESFALLDKELRDTKEKFEAVRKANIQVSAELSELKQQYERAQAQPHPAVEETEQELEDLKAKHNNLIIEGNQELKRLHDSNNNLRIEVQQAQSIVEQRDHHITQLQASIQDLNSKIVSTVVPVNETLDSTRNFQPQIAADQEALKQQQGEIEALKITIEQSNAEHNQQLKQRLAEAQQTYEIRWAELEQQAHAFCNGLSSENTKLEGTVHQLKVSAQNDNLQAAAVRQELEKLKVDYLALTTDHGNTQQELQQRDQLVNDLKAQSARLERDNEDKDVVITNLELEKEELTQAKEESKLQSGEINALYHQQDMIKACMQDEIDRLKKGNLIAAKQVNEIRGDRDNQIYFLKQEKCKVESLERDIKDLNDNQIRNLQQQVQTLNGELSTLKQQDMMNSAPSHTLHNQIAQLQCELKKEQATRVTYQGRFDTANKKIDVLNKELARKTNGGGKTADASRMDTDSSTEKLEDHLRQQIEQRNQHIKQLEHKIAEKAQNTEMQEASDADMAEKVTALTRQIDSLRCDNDQKAKVTDKLEKQVVELSYEAQQNDARARNIQNDFQNSRKLYKEKIDDLQAEAMRLSALTSANAPLPTFKPQKRDLDSFYADMDNPKPNGREFAESSDPPVNTVASNNESNSESDEFFDLDFVFIDDAPVKRKIAPLPSRVTAVHPDQNATLQNLTAQTVSPFTILADPSQCLFAESSISAEEELYAAIGAALQQDGVDIDDPQPSTEPQFPAPQTSNEYDPEDPDSWTAYLEDPNFYDDFNALVLEDESAEPVSADNTQQADHDEL